MSCECERIDDIFNYFSQQESLGKSISLGSYAKLDAPATKQNIAPKNFRICALALMSIPILVLAILNRYLTAKICEKHSF